MNDRYWANIATLITTSVRWAVLPPLVRLGAIKYVLSKPLVHLIVSFAQPPAQGSSPAHIRWIRLHTLPEMRRAMAARIQGGQGGE